MEKGPLACHGRALATADNVSECCRCSEQLLALNVAMRTDQI